jgi:hypothetical protein
MQQLNFLTGYDDELIVKSKPQLEFWDAEYRPAEKAQAWNASSTVKYFTDLDYSCVPAYVDYWKSLIPKNDSDIFRRWLFAFMSVHTTWKDNIIGYNAVKDWWRWINDWPSLLQAIQASGVGMHNMRVKYLSEFAYKFWEDPEDYKKSEGESWSSFRDRLKDKTLGLGNAKTSFAIELCYPTQAKVVCLDTHMFQAYHLDQTKNAKQYDKIERHWIHMCNMWSIPSYIARCIYWDKKQGFPDSRYWSHVLEQATKQPN